MDTIKDHLYRAVHRSNKSATEIAEETGISYSYLCRAALPLDESGVKFPIEYLIPVMRASGDWSLINHLCRLAGGLFVRIPRVTINKMAEAEAVTSFNETCNAAAKCLTGFFKTPSRRTMSLATHALQQVMEESASLQKRVTKTTEPEFDFNENP